MANNEAVRKNTMRDAKKDDHTTSSNIHNMTTNDWLEFQAAFSILSETLSTLIAHFQQNS